MKEKTKQNKKKFPLKVRFKVHGFMIKTGSPSVKGLGSVRGVNSALRCRRRGGDRRGDRAQPSPAAPHRLRRAGSRSPGLLRMCPFIRGL